MEKGKYPCGHLPSRLKEKDYMNKEKFEFNINVKTILGYLGLKAIKTFVSFVLGFLFISIIFSVIFKAGMLQAFFGKDDVKQKQTVAQKAYDANLKEINQQEQEVEDTINARKSEQETLNASDTAVSASVIYVIDGDTIIIKLDDGSEEKVRFIGVDCPEDTTKKEYFGDKATAYTKHRLLGKTIKMEYDIDHTDKYGRTLAYVFIDGELFNKTLVSKGYAETMEIEPNTKYSFDLSFECSKAKSRKIGMWEK